VKLALKCANPAEWLALRAGRVPEAAAEAWGGMALSGVVVAAVRSGVTARLAGGEATAPKIAADLGQHKAPEPDALAGMRLYAPNNAGQRIALIPDTAQGCVVITAGAYFGR